MVVKEPTCDENGSKVKSCINCNKEVSEATDQLGHSWKSGEVTVKTTTDAKGEKTYTCTRCGESKPEAIPKITYLITAILTLPSVQGGIAHLNAICISNLLINTRTIR